MKELADLLQEEPDPGLEEDWGSELEGLAKGLDVLELRTMLQGEEDAKDAIVTIQPGAGGTESQDWAEMLVRMYTRWAERRDLLCERLGHSAGGGGRDQGRHPRDQGRSRLRVSEGREGGSPAGAHFSVDAQARTSHIVCQRFVYPLVDDDIEIEVDESELRIDTYRASGAGGQHVNKTDSAVRLTHLPTGIVVACQQERSQHKNRSTAMRMLKAALYEHALAEKEREKAAIEATQTEIGFGHQIRSYIFQPYTMVNDHRTELKIGDVHRVMDGDIDAFIEAFLKKFGAGAAA